MSSENVNIPEMTIKTREEIEDLKLQWSKDPCWDIEDTEGFEAHREELTAYHEQQVRIWDARHEEKERAEAAAINLSDNRQLARYIKNLERRLAEMEQRVNEVKFITRSHR